MRNNWTFAFGLALLLAVPIQARAAADAPARSDSFEAEQSKLLVDAFELTQKGKPAEAEVLFSKVINAYEKSAKSGVIYRCANGGLNVVSTLLGAVAQAPKNEIIAVGPNWCAALFGKGFVLIDLGRLPEAGPFLAKAVEMEPLNPHYINEYAEWFKSQRNWTRSYSLFSQAWGLVSHDKKGPDRPVAARALRGMAFNLIEQGDLEQAEKLLKESLEYEPEAAKKVQTELDYIADMKAKRN